MENDIPFLEMEPGDYLVDITELSKEQIDYIQRIMVEIPIEHKYIPINESD